MREKGMIEFDELASPITAAGNTPQLKKIYLFYGGGSKQFNIPFISSINKEKLNFSFLIESMKWIYELNWLIKNDIITVLYRSPVNLRQVY